MNEREALKLALEALEEISSHYMSLPKKGCMALAAIEEVLAQPEQEPVARECSDPIAECEEGQREKEIEDLRFSLDFYQRRCEALQAWQCKMRDPERTIVCDILANGFTLDPAFAGDRYTAPPQRKPLTVEQLRDIKEHQRLLEELGPVWAPMLYYFCQAIERAHGIGEKK